MRFAALAIAALTTLLTPYPPAFAQTESSRLPDGAWSVSGYGTVFLSDRREVRTYFVNTVGCIRGEAQSHGEFLGQVGELSPPAAPDRVVLRSGPSLYVLTRLKGLPPSCQRPLRTRDPLVNFESFVSTFTQLYPGFESRGVDWKAAQSEARSRISNGDDLFEVLSDLVAPLRDDHIRIDAGERSYAHFGAIAPGAQPGGERWTSAALAASLRDYLMSDASPLVSPPRVVANRKAILGRLPGDIGYLAIVSLNNWAPLEEDASTSEQAQAAAREMQALLAELVDVRGLVIDLRINVGGHDAVALATASRFADEETAVFSKDAPGDETEAYVVQVTPSDGARFTGPIAILVSPNTVSAAEVLALALSALPNGFVLGQPTRGAFSDAVPRQLPNGWTYTLAAETYRTLDGVELEGKGLLPDQPTPSPESSVPAVLWGRDIGAAVNWINTAER